MIRSGNFAKVVIRIDSDGTETIRCGAGCLYSARFGRGGGVSGPGRFLARHFAFVLGGIFLVVGCVLLFGGYREWEMQQRFDANGVTAEGTVLAREIVRRRKSAGERRSTRYRVTYRFGARSGETLEHSDDVDVHTWEALEEQGPVTVEYLRDEPAVSRVAGESDPTEARLLMGIGGPFARSTGYGNGAFTIRIGTIAGESTKARAI